MSGGSNGNPAPGCRIDLSIVSISTAMLMFEILQTVLLSFQTIERNAFLVVSMCLLGLGGGGSIATVLGRRVHATPVVLLWWNALGFSVTLVAMTFVSSWTTDLRKLIAFGVFPYLFVGIFLALVFRTWPEAANRSYFLNLVGSGIGCLALIGLMDLTGDGPLAVLLIAGLALFSAALIASTRTMRWATLAVLSILLALVPWRARLYGFSPAPLKGIAFITNNPEISSEITWSRWGYLGRLDVLRPGEGIERFHLGGREARRLLDEGVDVRYLFASGGNWTKAIDFRDKIEFKNSYVRESKHSLAYLLTSSPKVLNIGFGGGIDIFLALQHGARSVVGVDINPLMVRAGREAMAGYYDDFYNDDRVTIEVMDGRTYVRNTPESFDVVSLTAVDTGELLHSNALVLLENYLYTLEAFDDYLRVLSDEGFLYVSRPHIQTMRTIATAVATLRRMGIEKPQDHFAVLGRGEVRRGRWRNVLVGKSPLTTEQIERVWERYGENLVAYLPGHQNNDPVYGEYFEAVARGREVEYVAREPEDFSPVHDDRPFFYQFGRSLPDSAAGQALLSILRWVSIIAATLIVLPMLFVPLPKGAPGRRLIGLLGYFAAIGLGFMFVEIVLIQKLVLFLGHPAYSISVTLFTILVFSGLGSIYARRFDVRSYRTALLIWGPIILATLFYALGLELILAQSHTSSLSLRFVLVTSLLAPGSFFMGMPFPTMMRMMQGKEEMLIPWAWAINAFTSVAASTLAVFLAMQTGFSIVLLLGTAAYLLSLLFFAGRLALLGETERAA
jgi:spermidine synthase